MAGSPVHCNDIAQPRYNWERNSIEVILSWKSAMTMLPVYDMQIETLQMGNVGSEKNIYTRKQLEEFNAFQDNQGTQWAYLTEAAEMAFWMKGISR